MKQASRSNRISVYSVLILAVTSVLLTLLLIEIVLYLKPDLIPAVIRSEYFMSDSVGYPPGTIADGQVGYKFAPNIKKMPIPFGESHYTLSTVSLGTTDTGFRDDGIDGQTFGIVVGDSVTACVGVNEADCWVELLEQKTGQDFANLGVSGYGPDLQFRMLQFYGWPLRPKLVMWVFFANDVIQGWRFEQFGQGAVKQGEFWKNPVRTWLAKHSSIYLLLSYFWYERNFFRYLYLEEPSIAGDATLAWWLAYSDLRVPEVARGFERTQRLILEANRQTHERFGDVEFVVVIIPFREQILYTASDLQPVFDASGEELSRFCRQNKVSVIDLTGLIRARVGGEIEVMYFEDNHLTERGNQIVADMLAEELAKKLSP